MNVEIGAEGALFPEKEYINGIFVAERSAGPVVPSSNHSAWTFNIPTLYLHHCTHILIIIPTQPTIYLEQNVCWKHELNFSTNIFIILFIFFLQEQSMESVYSAWLADKYSF